MTIPFQTETLTKASRSGSRDPDTRKWNVSDDSQESFSAHVSPASGRDLELLPEGEVTGEEIKVITETELSTSNPDTDPAEHADHILYEGRRYKVMNVTHYKKVLPHYEAICVRV